MHRRSAAIALTLLGAGVGSYAVTSCLTHLNGVAGNGTTRSSSFSTGHGWSSWGNTWTRGPSFSGSSSSGAHSSSISRGGFGSHASGGS